MRYKVFVSNGHDTYSFYEVIKETAELLYRMAVESKLFEYVSGVVIKQYCPTACEEQTMIRCIDGREFHAPTRFFINL